MSGQAEHKDGERRLPQLFCEQMANEQEREVVIALSALACAHMRWMLGRDPSVDLSQLSEAEFDVRANASVDAYLERARFLIDVGISDALDIVGALANPGEVLKRD